MEQAKNASTLRSILPLSVREKRRLERESTHLDKPSARSKRTGRRRERSVTTNLERDGDGEERPRETEREDERALPPRSKQKL